MATFTALQQQQETNRKILEDLQLKKQLLQKPNLATINQMPAQPTDAGSATTPRSVFNPTNSSPTTLGYFIQQDSFYGNTFIPVLPRFDPLPAPVAHHPTTNDAMARLKLKKIEEFLQGVDGFESPKVKLEQYPTPPHIASCMLYNMQAQYDDIENKLVGDLGSGCGMLSIGAFLLGAQLTIGFEVDADAIDVLRSNISEMELPSAIDCVQADVLQLGKSKWQNTFDTIVMNPPFGTKNNAGIDMRFIETAMQLATNAVYSLHKTSTREFIQKKCKEWQVHGTVVAELKYNLNASYKFHKQKSVDIEVDFWRFDVTGKSL